MHPSVYTHISFQVEIIVTGNDNDSPYFDASEYEVTVTGDSGDVILDLSEHASDPDAPNFGTGEIIFIKDSETDMGTDGSTGKGIGIDFRTNYFK